MGKHNKNVNKICLIGAEEMDWWSRELVLAENIGSVPSIHSAPRDPGLSDLCRYQEYIQCLIYSVPYIFRYKIHTCKK